VLLLGIELLEGKLEKTIITKKKKINSDVKVQLML
jgi:hypothetical protein